MSRQNKVNPAMYTQRGRLTQDDAARELRKQSAIASPHTWQPANANAKPRQAPAGDDGRDTERSAVNETMSPSTAKAKAAKAKTARTTTKRTRKAVQARNAGTRRAAPRATRKRRQT